MPESKKRPSRRRIVIKRGERKHDRFQIGPNSPPQKVARWLSRGGGANIAEKPHKHASAKQ